MGSLVLSFSLSLLAAKWASPDQQESLLQEDHTCPTKPPANRKEECKTEVRCKTKWKLFHKNVLLFVFSTVIAWLFPIWLPQGPIDKARRPPESVLDFQIFMYPGTYTLDTFLDNLSVGSATVIIDPLVAEDLHRQHIKISVRTTLKDIRLKDVLDLILIPKLPEHEQWTYAVTGNTVTIRKGSGQ